jgi:hypothetical protein
MPFISLSVLMLLSACDNIVDGQRAAVSSINKSVNESVSLWSDLFTYHPPVPPQEAQTRYCYRMMSDIVCYDSVQPTLTAKLIGYQDGNKVSWVQPGGGSLGASGSNPVALQPERLTNSPKPDVYAVQTPVEASVVENPTGHTAEIQQIPLSPK